MKKVIFISLALLISLAAATVAANDVNKDIAAARQATAKYHQLDRALADGYEPLFGCIPGEGYHYINWDLVDGNLDPKEPEILVYVPNGKDNVKLGATEYVTPGDLPMPSLFGEDFHQVPLDPPIWALHAWVWLNNPDGMFTDLNPKVECP